MNKTGAAQPSRGPAPGHPTTQHAEARLTPVEAAALLPGVLVCPHRSLQDKRRFIESTGMSGDSFLITVNSDNDAMWWMRMLGHGARFGIQPLILPLHDVDGAALAAEAPDPAELPLEATRWTDRIERYLESAHDVTLTADIAASALTPHTLLAILGRLSSRLPRQADNPAMPDGIRRWLLLMHAAFDGIAAAHHDVAALTEQAVGALNLAWAHCAGSRPGFTDDTPDPGARQVWLGAFIETALHERLLAQDLHPALRRCLRTIASWADGDGPAVLQVLRWLPQALERTCCKATAEWLVALLIPWIRVRSPRATPALMRLDITSFLQSALRHAHRQAEAQPMAGWNGWPQWLADLCSPIELDLAHLSEEVRCRLPSLPEPQAPHQQDKATAVAHSGGGTKRPHAGIGNPAQVKRSRIRPTQGLTQGPTQEPTTGANDPAERIGRWLAGIAPRPPRPPAGANAWWLLNEALSCLRSLDRRDRGGWQAALEAARRWSKFLFLRLQTLPDGSAIPPLALTLMQQVWELTQPPAQWPMKDRAEVADAWQSFSTDHLMLALHPRLLRGVPQAALVQHIGAWAPSATLDPGTAMELLERVPPAIADPADRLSLVKALLPAAHWTQTATPSQRIKVLLLILLKDSAMRGTGAEAWMAGLKQLFGPMHLDPDDAVSVLLQSDLGEHPAAVDSLMAWLWPFIHAQACKAGENHPVWPWMATRPATLKSLRRLPTESALACLQILSLPDRQWGQAGAFETAWCALFSHLRQRIDLISPDDSKELQAGLQGVRALFERHPLFQATPSSHVLDDIDWAVWEGLRGQALADMILRTLEGAGDLQAARARLESRRHLVEPPEPTAKPSRQTLAMLLGADRFEALMRQVDDLIRSKTTRRPEFSAPRAATTKLAFGDELQHKIQASLDELSNADIEGLIRQGVAGKPLLREMLERGEAGTASKRQLQRWARTEYVGPGDECRTMREILDDEYHDILLNVAPDADAALPLAVNLQGLPVSRR